MKTACGLSGGIALCTAAAALAVQPACVGDCDGTATVTVSEVIVCVTQLLGAPLESCGACDADGDGVVAVNELVGAVNAVLAGCAPLCGDGQVERGEECDDGNNVGGDGCAANCTRERRRSAAYAALRTFARVQNAGLQIPLTLAGSEALTTGRMRSETVFGPDGRILFEPGQIPVVIRTADLSIGPVSVPGLRCACVRAVEVPEFGPGNAASGLIGCGPGSLADADVEVVQDHNTTPNDPGNSGPLGGDPDDPECDDRFSAPRFTIESTACLEGSGAECSTPLHYHIGVCNGPRHVRYSGGAAPAGAALIVARIAIGLPRDTGLCATTAPRRGDGTCLYPDYGPDCLPCTDDDLDRGIPQTIPLTTAGASGIVLDANDFAGESIAPGADCSSPCAASVAGAPFDCSALETDLSGGLAGGALAGCFPVLDSETLGDNVVCTVLATE